MLKISKPNPGDTMPKADQKGFSIIEAILILVVIGVLGFTGWFVYHARQTANKDLSSKNSTGPYV
jgi:Tfp pilus assembly protein PilV